MLGLNAYAPSLRGIERQLRTARAALTRRWRRTPVWITEIGWATGGPATPGRAVAAAAQARLVHTVIGGLAARRRIWGLRGIISFSWRDGVVCAGGTDFWGLYTGLHAGDGTPKPAADPLRRVTQRFR